ncbi:MAG: 30S ribosomal protein S21 [Lentisphaerae bacterium]|nr:MAG: 30S ribosomal protein S21 [Lentisphaerota bacterium]
MTEIRVRRDEPIEKALRRLKKKMDKEGILKDIRNRRYYEKPSEVKRRLAKKRQRG